MEPSYFICFLDHEVFTLKTMPALYGPAHCGVAGGTDPDAPAGSARDRSSTPLPVPASTDPYAGAAEIDQCAVLSGSRRSISFFTTA